MSKSRLIIGLYVSDFNDESVRSLCNGAVNAASEINAYLIIFPGMHLNADFNDLVDPPYYYQYNTIYDIGNKENLDMLIVLTGNIGNTLNDIQIQDFLSKYPDLPIMTVSSEHSGYSSIKFDNKTGFNKAINHLIHKHNCRKIGFVSGSKFNADARERLEVYCQTLLENNLPVDHNLIVYGNFSPLCEHEVTKLLENNPDIDAICFANDEMAKGGYKALAQSKYKVGKNISVIGFDNTQTSLNLYPSLTTVNADNFQLGYQAVLSISKLGKNDQCHIVVPTNLIVRNSCGCRNTSFEKLSYLFSDTKMNKERIAACTIDDYMTYIFGSEEAQIYSHFFSHKEYKTIKQYFRNFFETVLKYSLSTKPKSYRKSILNAASRIISTGILNYIPVNIIYNAIDALYCKVTVESQCKDDIGFIFNQIYREISTYNKACDQNSIIDIHDKDFIINSIINDVIITEEANSKAFFPAMRRLTSLGFSRSYMLLFEKTISHNANQDWKPDDKIYLKFSQEDDDIKYYKESPCIMISDLFSNKYIDNGKPGSLIINPLFSNDEIYGLLLCDITPDLYIYMSKITLQISTALKYNSLLVSWQSMLASEKENSRNFELISKHDELTGVYNRRGYFDYAQSIISNPANEGKNAIVVFADLDNLKVINDRFGHDDGDYALKAIADILLRSFRTSDIIGRIGGDEFAVFAIMNNTDNVNVILNRINLISENFNKSSSKPYYINMSLGIYPFVCNQEIWLSNILDNADELLYKQKKEKRKCILKNPENLNCENAEPQQDLVNV